MWGTLKNKNFSIFVYSQTVSQFGDKLDYIALIGIIGLYPEARNPFLMSLLAFFTTAPVVIFGPIAGVLVDRWHKKKVMVVCDALRMLCAFMIPVVYLTTHNIYPVFLVVFFLFLFTLFFNAARSAIIPNLVTKKYILRANSVINFVGRVATFLGILIGGLIVDWQFWDKVAGVAGWTVAFILDGITFGVSAVMLYVMRVKLPDPPKHEKHLEARGFLILIRSGLIRVLRELKHAVKDIFREKNLGFAMAAILLMIIVGSVVLVLVIPTVQKGLDWGTLGVGLLGAVGAIGLLAGAWLVGVFGHLIDLKKLIIICFLILSGTLVIFPYVQNPILCGVLIFFGGLAISPVFIGQDSLIHHYADEFVRGRMFSIRDWIFNGLILIGALVIGSLATFAEKDTLFVIFGILVAVLAILGWFIFARGKGTAVSQDHA